jgi:hypothetical protein
MITNALSKLVDDKHLRTQGNFFNVGGNTLLFIQHGKYLGFVNRENIREQKELSKEELKHLLDDATLKLTDSLIKTNSSVSDTNDFQKIFGIGSLIIGGVNMLFILVTTYRQCQDMSPQEMQGIKIQLQKIGTTLKHMKPYILEKDSAKIKAKDSL